MFRSLWRKAFPLYLGWLLAFIYCLLICPAALRAQVSFCMACIIITSIIQLPLAGLLQTSVGRVWVNVFYSSPILIIVLATLLFCLSAQDILIIDLSPFGEDLMLQAGRIVAICILPCMALGAYFALCKSYLIIEEKAVRQAAENASQKEAMLMQITYKLQPHFLFNSLNSIQALCLTEPAAAADMTIQLADLLRKSISKENSKAIDLQEELSFLELYIAIEKRRFSDRLLIHLTNEVSVPATIPPMLLQPLAENAIKHGLDANLGNVTIEIHCSIVDHFLVVEIRNKYIEMQHIDSGLGIGLNATRKRLLLLYGRNDLLETSIAAHYFTAKIIIPQSS